MQIINRSIGPAQTQQLPQLNPGQDMSKPRVKAKPQLKQWHTRVQENMIQ